jgi:hypothetical protein
MRRPVLLLLLWIACLLWLPLQVSADGEVSLATYQELWQIVRDDLESADSPIRGSLLTSLDAITHLTLPDGRSVPADHRWLLTLIQEEGATEENRNRLDALLQLWQEKPPLPADPQSADTLLSILARNEFNYDQTILQRLWRTLGQWLFELLDNLLFFGGDGSLLATLLVWVGGLAVLGLLVWWGVNLGRQFVRGSALPPSEEPERPPDSRTAWYTAQEHARAGDRRMAVRLLWLAALVRLDEAGVVPYDRTRTNREYLGAVRESADLHHLLTPIIRDFDRVWYGFESLDDGAWAAYSGHVARLLAWHGAAP